MRSVLRRNLLLAPKYPIIYRGYTSEAVEAQQPQSGQTAHQTPPISFHKQWNRTPRRIPPKDIVVSGIQPTGIPHLGNYLGALRQWKDLQDEEQQRVQREEGGWNQLIFSIVDLHALTGHQKAKEREQLRRETFASLLAIGLDPKYSNIFFQSDVPGHTELMWILSTVASTGYLSRMTQWKSKLELPDSTTLGSDEATEKLKLGLFSYPVLQAADILLYRGTLVPVGEDQSQHIEFARSLAGSFNAHYAEGAQVLFKPKAMVSPAKRIMSLRDPTNKMSKSHTDPKSRILITDTSAEIQQKMKSAVTDSEDGISYDPIKRPGVSNLVDILKHVTRSRESCEQIAKEHASMSKSGFKEMVGVEITKELAHIRYRFNTVQKPGNELFADAYTDGRARARTAAGKTMGKVREVVGISTSGWYFNKFPGKLKPEG